MTKVLKLGRNQEEAEIYNYFQDRDNEIAGTWLNLYEDNQDIENNNCEHIDIIAVYLINNGFSRSGKHLLNHVNPLWKTCKLKEATN